MDAVANMPVRERLNLRVIVFAGVVLFLLGAPTFVFVRQALTKGVVDHGSYAEVDLKALGNFIITDTDTIDAVPPVYRKLDGRRVLLTGLIWAPSEAGDVGQFQLVYNIMKCCFGGPPKPQERVFCTVTEGRRLERPDAAEGTMCNVMGTLHVKLVKDEFNKLVSVYTMDVEKITAS